ncbi:hypothetical protein JOF53_000614 [Crossiella equi]|uniref:Uncharacterized protein n=1 Tax=Crossiella equi TaxID=130796 RepID=A0ABS5A580_9PSEU|nr:hypothetical protein [Crossiella equi]MBP2471742.1 hypothetical protein [Crossiella equi]
MTTPEFSETALREAIAELDQTITTAQDRLYEFERDNQPTREELAALQREALRGELGPDMQRIARQVEDGRDTWQSVFTGTSPLTALLRGHLDRMAQENREAIGQAIEEDEDFDPFPPQERL